MNATVAELLAGTAVGDLDRQFARFLEKLEGTENGALRLAAALVSRRRGEGDICLDLRTVAGRDFPEDADEEEAVLRCPDFEAWCSQLRRTRVVGEPGEFKPLILDGQGRLYLHRYWDYENRVTQEILRRSREKPGVDWEKFRAGMAALFPEASGKELDWQKIAAFAAVRKSFCVISGGPGTGKTRTVVRLLALLIGQTERPPRIALVAPTGKAAARLQDSIKMARGQLGASDEFQRFLPETASTIHRLLRPVPGSPYFRHHSGNRLPIDILVVDEASMVDLALLAKLLEAAPPNARVVLLGDKDQLASVEAGAVLGDICQGDAINRFSREFCEDYQRVTGQQLPAECRGIEGGVLRDGLIQLTRNYRFGQESGIFRLSRMIQHGAWDDALRELRDCEKIEASGAPGTGAVHWRKLPQPPQLKKVLREIVLRGFGKGLAAPDPREALEEMGRFRILCALRQGPYGIGQLNLLVEEILEEAELIQRNNPWYRGRPVMISRNDYDLKLFNGDIGVLWPDQESGEIRAFFLDAGNELRKCLPLRLPPHETVYAMTVHKSQGSEFQNLLFILPDKDCPVLTRELIYTGLTRASQGAELWVDDTVFRAAVERPVQRASGLKERLGR
jgi:exodeoxyribonuclease V alpha subunit